MKINIGNKDDKKKLIHIKIKRKFPKLKAPIITVAKGFSYMVLEKK